MSDDTAPWNVWIIAVVAAFRCALGVAAETDSIPMVGLDQKGEGSRTLLVDRSQYVRQLGTILKSVDASARDALNSSRLSASPHGLSMVLIGIAMDLDVGLGPVASAKASAEFNLVYSNRKVPAVP